MDGMRLSDQRMEEHLRKFRISRKQKRAATLDVNVNEGDLGRLNLDECGCDHWLHRNPTYIRQDRPTEHVVPMSFNSGRNTEPIGIFKLSIQYIFSCITV